MIFETETFSLRAFWRGDWEMRVGPYKLTVLSNGRGDGGVFLAGPGWAQHWPWPRVCGV